MKFNLLLDSGSWAPFQSVGPPNFVRRPGAHTILLCPGGVGVSAGGEAALAIGHLLRPHLGHQVSDGVTHVWRTGKGRGRDGVGGTGG